METRINKLVETDIEISSLVVENSWPKYGWIGPLLHMNQMY